MVEHLRALCFALWGAIHPSLPLAPDAPAIAQAIAEVVAADESPVFGDLELETAVQAYYAFRESWLQRAAIGDGGRSFGVWQEPAFVGSKDIRTQAVYWLFLLHEGQRLCAGSPAAPLSGGCVRARALADRRVARAIDLLVTVKTSM